METLGGQDQIPFLVDHQHGVELYESDDIIEHLEEHYARETHGQVRYSVVSYQLSN